MKIQHDYVYSEGDVITHVILPILTNLGYDIKNNDEVAREYAIPVGTTEVAADIVILLNKNPSFVIDGKNPREDLDNHKTQILSYGTLLKVKYAVLCNGVRFRCYDVSSEKVIWDKPVSSVPGFLNKQNMKKERASKISRSRIASAKKALMQIEGTKQFSTLLYKCEDLIRDNDGLTGESAFDQMSKVLFMKMWYEKIHSADPALENPFVLSNVRSAGGANYVKNFLFAEVKKSNPDLIADTDNLDLCDETLMSIIAFFDDYTLLDTEIDVKGEAFEIFLGRTLTGDLGQFFTPRTIVDFVVSMVEPKVSTENDDSPYLVLDPSCGTGGFLIQAFLKMSRDIRTRRPNKQRELKMRLAEDQIYGFDINPRLARVAKMNMFLHGDGHGGIYTHNGLLDLDNKTYENKFDLVITNPPFGNKDDKPAILKNYELAAGRNSQQREILFIERCIQCLKAGGVLAIVLPDGILNNPKMEYVRSYAQKHMIIDAVVSLPIRSFKAVGANSKTSVLFLHKKISASERQHEIFMAKAQEVGFERKTKIAKRIERNDLTTILNTYKNYKSGSTGTGGSSFRTLCDEHACFILPPELVQDRFDASFFYAEYIYDVGTPYCRVRDVADTSFVSINLKKTPSKKIQYIEYSSIDKHVGDITNTTTHYGSDAPNRAKYVVRAGDVVCARMLDSEKNVAIVPGELDGEVATNGFVILRPKHPMTSESLFAVLRKNTTTEQVRLRAVGTIMPTISEDDYMNLKIPKLGTRQIKEYTKQISAFNKNAAIRKRYLQDIFEG